ncbi:MAG: sulfotransferase family 2 domain-containing protein [Paracoccaceae bacterium]
MPYVMPGSGLAYFSVPKVACTSIKHFLYEIEHGHPYAAPRNRRGKPVFIHRHYPSLPFALIDHPACAGLHRFSVVRDPVRRVLSAYGNRVLGHRELSEKNAGDVLRAADLPTTPDLATFITHLDRYAQAVRSIRHHTRPLVHFLGNDPAYFDRLYRFDELDQMADDIRCRTGRDVALPWLQVKGPRIDRDALTDAQVGLLRRHYAEDYATFGAWFDQEARSSARTASKSVRLGR